MIEIRWQQRYQNFSKAFQQLTEIVGKENLNKFEQAGLVQIFELAFELAWKVLKDKMENDGLVLDQVSPKAVVKQAYAAKYIDSPETWLRMIGDRNLMSHTYDFVKFEAVVQSIASFYLPMLQDWYMDLLDEVNNS